MLKFAEFIYERPNMEEIKAEFKILLQHFFAATSLEETEKILDKINAMRSHLSTMESLVYIRASIDTRDEFYKAESDYMDEILPEIEEMSTEFYKLLIQSPYREKLEAKYGKQLFALAEVAIKSFAPEVIGLMQRENKLTTEYANLIAAAEIEFNGETLNLAQLEPYKESQDRNIRKQATDAYFNYYATHQAKLDTIYDELVKIRHEIATTLGFENFIELGYLRMSRTDYNPEMVEVFRKQVRDYIVPLATKLFEKQRERIEVDTLMFYDEKFRFQTGNATPKGSPEWIIANGKKMYAELSPETKKFFEFMLERNLMDLEAKKGKESGGYCAYLEDYAAPFIFSNFNGTSGDIDVLTHEAGHAFQSYESRHFNVPEYFHPTSESAEIHSMSMEFFTWPWMELFFQEDTNKYKFAHLAEAIQFIPYGVLVDEFQHLVYENPDWTPAERNAAWKKLETVYLPHRNYGEHAYLQAGAAWQRQLHIYEVPFYYIDYTLAQICALQFWKRMQDDREEAWQDYVKLCQLGGSKPFLELVKAGNLRSPFEDSAVEETIAVIENWLDSVDDKKL